MWEQRLSNFSRLPPAAAISCWGGEFFEGVASHARRAGEFPFRLILFEPEEAVVNRRKTRRG